MLEHSHFQTEETRHNACGSIIMRKVQVLKSLMCLGENHFENIVGKGENADNHFPLFT